MCAPNARSIRKLGLRFEMHSQCINIQVVVHMMDYWYPCSEHTVYMYNRVLHRIVPHYVHVRRICVYSLLLYTYIWLQIDFCWAGCIRLLACDKIQFTRHYVTLNALTCVCLAPYYHSNIIGHVYLGHVYLVHIDTHTIIRFDLSIIPHPFSNF